SRPGGCDFAGAGAERAGSVGIRDGRAGGLGERKPTGGEVGRCRGRWDRGFGGGGREEGTAVGEGGRAGFGTDGAWGGGGRRGREARKFEMKSSFVLNVSPLRNRVGCDAAPSLTGWANLCRACGA